MQPVRVETIRKRRNRRGRSFKHSLIPSHLPGYVSPTERFDELIVENMAVLYSKFEKQLASVEILVEDVPPHSSFTSQVLLGNYFPAKKNSAAKLVLYRRPIESRALSDAELSEIIFEVIIDNLAVSLGVSPQTLKDLI